MNTAGEPDSKTSHENRFPGEAFGGRAMGGVGILFALGYAPMLALFFGNLWGRAHYQFFPLALIGAVFLAWTRRKEVPRPFLAGDRRLTALLLASSFSLLAAATVLWSPWLGGAAAWLGLAGMLWWQGGRPLLRAMLPALVLLLAIVPPPLSADMHLIQDLRARAVRWSSRLLDILGVTHALSGNVIELPGQQLLVDEACSGINSVLITLAGALFYGLWRRRSAIHILLCLVSALASVLLGNLARITLGAWLKWRYGIDVLSGTAHEVIGLILLVSYLVMIISMDQLLLYLAQPIRSRAKPDESLARRGRPLPGIPQAWVRGAGCAFALLGLADLGLVWIHHQHAGVQTAVAISSLRAGATFAMPEQIGGWKRLSTEVPPLQKVETMGVFSQIWHYRKGDTLASFALDYPFKGYHDVTVCYTLRGWDLLERQSRVGRGTNAPPPFAEARLQNHVGLHGALWFGAVDERGRWLEGPGLKPALTETLLRRIKLGSLNDSVSYQMQVLSTSFNPLSPDEREQVGQLFQAARQVLWRQLLEQMQRRT